MSEKHVVSISYCVSSDKNISYNNPPAVNVSREAYDLMLADGILTVTMKEHHPTLGSAIERVRNELRAWEIQTALELGPGHIKFEYKDAEIVDLDPPPSGVPQVLSMDVACGLSLSVTADCHIAKGRYPDPPSRFAASPMVEHLWNRYEMYLAKRDLLTTMGYVCLSMIQSDAGSRRQASVKYKIDRDVLDKLGSLTSDVGDESTARKFDQRSTKRAHTATEKSWVEEVVKHIIHRVGEYDFDASAALSPITMASLPPL
jgi:hypothetical protein